MHPGAMFADVGHLHQIGIERLPAAAVLRKVFKCMCGEQEAIDDAVSRSSAIFSRISGWPGSEHMYL